MNAAQDTPGHEGRAQGQKRPTADPEIENTEVYRYAWRHTNMGGTTANYVVCMTCRQPLHPDYTTTSKSGTHGQDIYIHEKDHKLESITLLSSNTGKRRYSCSTEDLEPLAKKLYIAWFKDRRLPDEDTFKKYALEFLQGVKE